ncbi:P2X purinoceptor 2 [Nowakowskiella sp. JEL0078]|nr:P2X purinoceptor 2 [Nowakowskiella sp. JEL0078]
MKGELLYGCNSANKKFFEPSDRDYFDKTFGTRLDIIYLSEFLRASACGSNGLEFSLNNSSDAPNANGSYRSSGLVLSVPIFYSNRLSDPTQLKYQYIPAKLDKTEYKIVQSIRNPDNTTTFYNRHGVRFVFTQTGTIGIFDFQSLLVNLVAALALTKLASMVVELMMLYILPRRNFYNDVKFDEECYNPELHGTDSKEEEKP